MTWPVFDSNGPADIIAPDGMEVRILPAAKGGGMAHFRMPPGKTGRAVRHRTVDELWHILSGAGQMWLSSQAQGETVLDLAPGVSFAIPVGSSFQLRNPRPEPLDVIAITIPPWPGDDEAVLVDGKWPPTV